MAKQRGQTWPVNNSWRQAVDGELTKRKWSRAQLGRAVGSTGQAISMLLTPNLVQSSRLVPRVHAVFGWPPPVAGRIDADDEIGALWSDLSDEQRRLVLELARAIKNR